MSRLLRIEFPGTVHPVASQGDLREPIDRDDEDRTVQLDIIGVAMDRFDAQILACCQMGSHNHFVLHARWAKLSQLMRDINGVCTRAFKAAYWVGRLRAREIANAPPNAMPRPCPALKGSPAHGSARR